MLAATTIQPLGLCFPIRPAGQDIAEFASRHAKEADVMTAQLGAGIPAEIKLAMIAQMDLGDDIATG